MPPETVTINARDYRLPRRPTAVITIDGCDPSYLDDALDRRLLPRLAEMLAAGGAYHLGRSQMPSFTNTNNMSIVTGAPPVVHGLPGNHCLAPNGEEVQLSDPSFLRAPSIHAELQKAGAKVLAITAKDKLRRLLAAGDVPGTSAEKAHEHGIPAYGVDDVVGLVGRRNPGPYEWDMSHYAIEIGIAVSRRVGMMDLMYLSTTDFVQHAEGPGGPMADRYFRRFDELLGQLLDLGYAVGMVADHGMNAKHDAGGAPRVHYLDDVLTEAGIPNHHVILPITDPYVVHHGALGSFAWVHVAPDDGDRARAALAALDGVEEVFTREEAATIYQHPADRIGDLSVASDAGTALGKSAAKHDLSVLAGPLRSHGGRHEQIVPVVVSHPLAPRHADLHRIGVTNADIHDLMLNGVL
ncbi:MAG TPA: alkaline phosphatase family protein [Thermomicrobiales bacterium]|nr:alkaline phosphatase family protein [Thermomicrobiales bacterium]